MPQKSFRDALNEAMHLEMERDASIIVLGEDVSGGAGGTSGNREASGGIFGVTKGLLPRFGENRVIDTPISESAIIGAAGGAALAGMRPIAELMFADFVGVSMDQIFNQMAKFRYMFGGKTRCPAVVRLAMGAGMNMGAQHSQSIYAMLTAVPGLKVVVPSNAYDAKGLLIQAIRDDDPGDVLRAQGALPAKRRSARRRVHGAVRRGEPAARRRARHGRCDRAHGGLRGKGDRHAGEGRHHLRPDRPAHDLAARRGDDPRERREHRPTGRRRRIESALQRCFGHLRDRRREGLPVAQGGAAHRSLRHIRPCLSHANSNAPMCRAPRGSKLPFAQ